MRSPLGFALALGFTGGLVEAAVRLSPRMGLDGRQVATFVGLSVVLSLAWTVGSVIAVGRGDRAHGIVLGAYIGMQAAVNYRFEVVLNEFVREPRVWVGVLGCFLVGLAIGVAVNPALRRWMWIGPVLAVAAIPGRMAPTPRGAVTRPSVLFVSMDTTRFDHVADKPNFARLTREGVLFTQAIAAAPITAPSHLAMFTGSAPYRSGVVANGTNIGQRDLLWKSLGGMPSAAFVAGFPLHSKYGWAQGIDVYDDDFGWIPGLESLSLKKAWNQVAIKEHALRERSAERVLRRAIPWLTSHRDAPFFALVHFYDPHGPYESAHNVEIGAPAAGTPLALPAYWPAPFRGIADPIWLARAYDGEVRTVDDAIGALLAALGPALDRTIVVVTADHGETFLEHTPNFDHGDTLYDDVLRVPLVVRYPPVAKPGLVVDCQVAGIDLTPTILNLAGISDGVARQGLSRVPELKGEPCRDAPVLASTTAGRFTAVPPVDHALRGAGTKLILKQSGAAEFYDLMGDPEEARNLAPSMESEAVGELLRRLLAAGSAAVPPDQDATTREALKALGYTSEP